MVPAAVGVLDEALAAVLGGPRGGSKAGGGVEQGEGWVATLAASSRPLSKAVWGP